MLVCCYSGMENLWYGNWNRHVCHKWKYEVDRPSRLTVVNQTKKQKCCSRSCLWSQVQRDTSGPSNSQTLGCLWTKHHRCIDMWIWTEMQLFPASWEQSNIAEFLMNVSFFVQNPWFWSGWSRASWSQVNLIKHLYFFKVLRRSGFW